MGIPPPLQSVPATRAFTVRRSTPAIKVDWRKCAEAYEASLCQGALPPRPSRETMGELPTVSKDQQPLSLPWDLSKRSQHASAQLYESRPAALGRGAALVE